MLSNIFKKSTPPAPTTPAPKQPAAPTPEQIEAQVADKAVWEGKLEAARGDDNALMVIAKESPLIDIKHAAVEALVSEEALKRAEKEFRDHDRRVHRTAKQRYEKLVARRLAAVSAAKLTETAAVLLHGATIPANRLVELDRAWSALDQTLLEEKQIADYQAHWTKLSALTRERGEQQLKVRRWLADAEPATVSLNALAAQVAEGSAERSAFSDASAAVAAILAATPDGESSTHSEQINAQVLALNSALKLLSAIDARLKLLEELHLPTVPTPPHPPTPPADSPIASAEADLAVAVHLLRLWV